MEEVEFCPRLKRFLLLLSARGGVAYTDDVAYLRESPESSCCIEQLSAEFWTICSARVLRGNDGVLA